MQITAYPFPCALSLSRSFTNTHNCTHQIALYHLFDVRLTISREIKDDL